MSEYVERKLGALEEALIIKTLVDELGYPKQAIDTTPNNKLRGFLGDRREQRADITVKKEYLNGSANDIGFKNQGNDTWTLLESEYDSGLYGGRKSGSGGAQRNFIERFKQGYAAAKMKQQQKITPQGNRYKLIKDEIDQETGERLMIWEEI